MQPTILLVDTEVPRRQALRLLFEDAGYAVADAADSAAALEELRVNLTRKRPHRLVVLLHHSLPDPESEALLRSIAEDPHLATHHAYVLMSEVPEPALPPDPYIRAHLTLVVMPQPFEPQALLDVVAQAANGLGMEPHGAGRRD